MTKCFFKRIFPLQKETYTRHIKILLTTSFFKRIFHRKRRRTLDILKYRFSQVFLSGFSIAKGDVR